MADEVTKLKAEVAALRVEKERLKAELSGREDHAAGERKPWHDGYYGAMELDLKRHQDHLEFLPEFQLGKLPPRLDLEVIKKDRDYVVDEDFGKIYRTYNIHEYKSDQDQLGIDELSQATAYGFYLKHTGRFAEEYPLDEITISIFRRTCPRELFKKLAHYKVNVVPQSPGIYYVEGFSVFPTQIVVMKEFDKRHFALRSLGLSISEEEAMAFSESIKGLTDPHDVENVRAVLDVTVAANRELYERIWNMMGMDNAVLSIFQDRIDQRVEDGKRDAYCTVAERMISDGLPGDMIAKYSQLGRHDIDVIAARLNRTVTWGEARA